VIPPALQPGELMIVSFDDRRSFARIAVSIITGVVRDKWTVRRNA